MHFFFFKIYHHFMQSILHKPKLAFRESTCGTPTKNAGITNSKLLAKYCCIYKAALVQSKHIVFC